MRVSHVIQGVLGSSVGTTYSLRQLSATLAKLGNEVSILSLLPAPPYWPENVELKLFDAVLQPGIRYSWGLHREVRQRSLSPSIIHLTGLWRLTNLYAWGLPSSRVAKVVVSPRGMLSSYTFRKNRLGKAAWWHLLQKPALAQVDCFHATATAEYEDIRSAGLSKPVCVVPNGIDIPALNHLEKPNRRKLLFLSRIDHKKGLDMLLPAWRRLQDSFTDWDLVIAGPLTSDYAREIMADATTLGCHRVTFPGELVEEAKARAFGESDVFVLPTYSENFGLVVAEALSHAVPVVTTRGAPWHEVEQRRCGWWTEINEDGIHDALSEAMSKSRPELAEMGLRGRQWMEREYSWDHIGEMMQATFEWLLHDAARPPWVV